MRTTTTTTPVMMPSTKACPYCAEQIQVAAVICRFCNRAQPATTTGAPTTQRPLPADRSDGWTNSLLVVGTIVLGVMVATLQGVADNAAQFVGVALAPALFGVLLGGIRRIFGPTNVCKWMLGSAVVALTIEVLQRLTH